MLEVKYRKLEELSPYANNARKHPRKQLRKLAANIENFGFLVPIIIDQRQMILAGHARVEAAKLAGLKEIPTVSVEHLTDVQKKAFILSDNRLSQDASWDMTKLKAELEFLNDYDLEIDLTGFETSELDLIFNEDIDNPEDEIETAPPGYQAVTAVGDIWEMGTHRLICGDSTRPEVYEALLEQERAHMVFTDPPYNVAIEGHVKRKAGTGAREFVMASGEMSEGEFTQFLKSFLASTSASLVDGAILYVCMDWRHMRELQVAAQGLLEFKQLCIWTKDNGGMGTFYRSQHELVFVFKHGQAPHTNNFELGQKGRYRTNVWAYPMVHSVEDREGVSHPTVKPTALVADAIRDCSHRQNIILDPFGGSGTTLIAAEKVGRSARLIELDPIYCDMIVRRWEKFTGKKAILRKRN